MPKSPCTMRGTVISITVAILAILGTILYAPVARLIAILGVFKHPQPYLSQARLEAESTATGVHFKRIDDTLQCEDVHYYEPAHLVFTACEDTTFPRFTWWPAFDIFIEPSYNQGSIHVIDPKVCSLLSLPRK